MQMSSWQKQLMTNFGPLLKNMESGEIPLKYFKRFLDDIFLIFCGSVHKLHMFFEELNTIHPTIKFTMNQTVSEKSSSELETCSCSPSKSIAYLDTLCEIKKGKIITDLYRKPTDKNQYLLTSKVPQNKKVPQSKV